MRSLPWNVSFYPVSVRSFQLLFTDTVHIHTQGPLSTDHHVCFPAETVLTCFVYLILLLLTGMPTSPYFKAFINRLLPVSTHCRS